MGWAFMGIGQVIGVVLIAGVLLVSVLVVRRFRRLRPGGIDVALRCRPNNTGRGWHQGLGRYRGNSFVWFRLSSLRSGPDRVFVREQVQIVGRRESTAPESYAVPSESIVLCCRTDVGELELAMRQDTLTGFLSWLESAPPAPTPAYPQVFSCLPRGWLFPWGDSRRVSRARRPSG